MFAVVDGRDRPRPVRSAAAVERLVKFVSERPADRQVAAPARSGQSSQEVTEGATGSVSVDMELDTTPRRSAEQLPSTQTDTRARDEEAVALQTQQRPAEHAETAGDETAGSQPSRSPEGASGGAPD